MLKSWCAASDIFDEEECTKRFSMIFGNDGLYGKRSEESEMGMYIISNGIV